MLLLLLLLKLAAFTPKKTIPIYLFYTAIDIDFAAESARFHDAALMATNWLSKTKAPLKYKGARTS